MHVLLALLIISGLETAGTGDKTLLVRDQFSDEMRVRFDVFAVRCTKCHAMARPIAALQTGITPVTGHVFDQTTVKKYVLKMMRKPKSGITKADAKTILEFLTYALAIAEADRAKP